MQGKFYSCNDLSKMTEEECRYRRLCQQRDRGGSYEEHLTFGWGAFSRRGRECLAASFISAQEAVGLKKYSHSLLQFGKEAWALDY